MDIEQAIQAVTLGVPTGDQCRLGRWLADIPEGTAGKETLNAICLETNQGSPHWRTLEEIDAILRRLGLTTSNKTVANHRMRRCRCFA